MKSSLRKRLALIGAVALGMTGVSVVMAASAQAACTTYYISASGSDGNDGCSTSTPWQSLSKVNATTFAAGTRILFQDGGSWTGTLHPLGSGASGSPIVVADYGSGAAPIIAGAGAAEAVYLDDQSYITIENLEITNTAATAAVRSGIEVQNDTSGILSGISIVDNDIHDVLGYWSSSEGVQPTNSSGIAFNLNDSYATNGWNGVLIQGNTLTKTDAGAIYLGSLNGTGHDIATSNVVIQNNTITDSGGNDIVCVYCASPLVQYNVASDSGWRYSGAGLWTALSTNGVWQYNEVTDQGRAGSDGEAFDIDHGTSGTIVQYNYSHENPYGFQEYCCGSSTGAAASIVRYNISQNDGASNSVLPHQAYVGTGSTAQFYNNTIYLSSTDNAPIYGDAAPTGLSYSNNIIDKLGTGGYGTGGTWSHNIFYGNHPATEPADSAKLTTDPLFVSPGTGGDGLGSAAGYQLEAGSPALGSGVLISGNGGLDYFGNPVSSTAAPNRGAYAGAGATAPSLRGYWRLDEGTGTATSDSSGAGHPGTLQAGASWTTGKVGPYAVSLTGASTSYVEATGPAVDTGGSYSVSAWVKLNSVTGSNQTFASIDGSSISPFYLQLSAGKFAFTTRAGDSTAAAATSVAATSSATAGTWYNVVGVYDDSAHTIALYVNGTLQATAAFSSPWTASGDTAIGRAKWNGANVDFTNGAIDDVRMYSGALDRQAVVALATVPTAYYALDEGTGTVAGDSATGTFAAQLQAGASWTTGKVGPYAVSLTGASTSYVTVPTPVIDTGDSYSVSAWVKLNSVTGSNQTFASIDGSSISPFYLQLSAGKFAFTTRAGDSTGAAATSVAATSSATAGTWYNVVGVYDNSAHTIALYVNGTLQATAAFSSPWTASGDTAIGRAKWNGANVDFTNGAIDDVHFYPRALSAAEAAQLALG